MESHLLLVWQAWDRAHDVILMKGIIQHGYGNWLAMAIDVNLGLAAVIKQEVGSVVTPLKLRMVPLQIFP